MREMLGSARRIVRKTLLELAQRTRKLRRTHENKIYRMSSNRMPYTCAFISHSLRRIC